MYKHPKQKKQHHTFIRIALSLMILIGTFSLFSISFGLKKEQPINVYPQINENQEPTNNMFSFEYEQDTVEAKYILQKLEKLGNIKARSFLVGDLDTGEIIFERKPHTQYPIASITKYFTAYTAAKILDPTEEAVVTKKSLSLAGGNRAGFKTGDTLTIRELLYPLLLVSSNEAGDVIARHHDYDAFINSMNIHARVNGLYNTSFADPTGLSQLNISTARDLFKMMQATRTEYPEIVEISKLSSKSTDDHTWRNINKASSFSEFQGGKTGYTNAARQTSIGYYQIQLANNQTKNIGIIILQSNTRQQDTSNILNYLKQYVAYL
jgi:D-alanyl-D-alanine carboxypeptidase (penicillin-binding protein 5/6)